MTFVVIHATMVIKNQINKNKNIVFYVVWQYAYIQGRTAQTFTITKIGLHKRVFIITLNMIKSQKYPYTLNILFRTMGASPLHSQPIISSSNKTRCA